MSEGGAGALPAPAAADGSDDGGVELECESPQASVVSLDSLANMSSSGSPSCVPGDIGPSPRKLRRLALGTFTLPIEFHTPLLPISEEVTMVTLLAWHAGELVRKHGWQAGRGMRKTKKRGLSFSELCIQLAKDPVKAINLPVVTGKERVYASHTAAKVMSAAYQWSVRQGRDGALRLWPSTSPTIKNKWHALSEYPEYSEACTETAPPQPPSETASTIECYGAMMTWQTVIGRCEDRVQTWVNMRLSLDTLCDLLKGDAELKAFFEDFAKWVAAKCIAHGFHYWTASAEVCPTLQESIIHLHAYVCVDWRGQARKTLQKGRADRDLWKYQSFRPHVTPANVKGNMNLMKILTVGLFYCLIDKIGGLFTAGNVEAGKDRRKPVVVVMSRWSHSQPLRRGFGDGCCIHHVSNTLTTCREGDGTSGTSWHRLGFSARAQGVPPMALG